MHQGKLWCILIVSKNHLSHREKSMKMSNLSALKVTAFTYLLSICMTIQAQHRHALLVGISEYAHNYGWTDISYCFISPKSTKTTPIWRNKELTISPKSTKTTPI